VASHSRKVARLASPQRNPGWGHLALQKGKVTFLSCPFIFFLAGLDLFQTHSTRFPAPVNVLFLLSDFPIAVPLSAVLASLFFFVPLRWPVCPPPEVASSTSPPPHPGEIFFRCDLPHFQEQPSSHDLFSRFIALYSSGRLRYPSCNSPENFNVFPSPRLIFLDFPWIFRSKPFDL